MLSSAQTEERGSLEATAMLALEFGRLLMEAGAGGRDVEEVAAQVATGLGASRAELRVGYASLAITIGVGSAEITRMRKVGPLGVNQRLGQALRAAAARIERERPAAEEAREELDRVLSASTRHPDWLVALAVGVACGAFGRLLGVDWVGVGPIFGAAALGQLIRRELAIRQVNTFVAATVVACLAATVSGLVARWAGSQTVAAAMGAAVLLLVPGVPAINAQNDILEGRPTLGSARAVWVGMMLIFIAAGLWLAQAVLREGH